MGTKICHVSSVHPIWDTRIFHKECLSLHNGGYEVRLLVVDQESGRRSGIEVMSVNGPFKSRSQRIFRAPFALLERIAEMEDVEIVHLHDPELLRIGKKLKKLGKKVVYDAHEDHPRHIFEKGYFPRWVKRPLSFLLESYEDHVAGRMDAVVVPTPHIRDRFLKVNPNTVEVRNTPDLNEIPFHPPTEKDGKEICYIGKVTPQRGVRHLIEALEQLDGVTLNLVGPINEAFGSEIRRMKGWDKVREYGLQEREGVREVLRRSSAGMVVLQPYINFFDALPVKMFEYMAAGLPVLSSDFELWRGIVTTNDCGICVDPTDPSEIAEGIRDLLEDPGRTEEMGQNGRMAVEREYNWEKDSERLLALYEKLQR